VRAAVLAAGRGVRMRAALPKSLIPIADHEPLLFYILHGLKQAGVDDLIVVTGHGAGDVQNYVTERWNAQSVSFVFNARYASWGNFHSLRMALDQSPGSDVLAVNSDIVVNPDVFRRVVEGPGDLVLAVERRRRIDEEDMKVELRGDAVSAIGKNLPGRLSHGEFDGVSLLRAPAAGLYLDEATDLEWRPMTSLYYEDVYAMVLDRLDARAVFVEPGEYAEVDVPEDMAAAQNVIERFRDAWPDAHDQADAPEGVR
jgi:L-glutamine-phosphate cytidylyltransferase